MQFWIEVSDGDKAWIDKTTESVSKKRGLLAPYSMRYINFFKKIEPGDIILTYLTKQLTEKQEWRSSIVGISKIAKPYYEFRGYLYIETVYDTQLPNPIKYIDMIKQEGYSEEFKNMLKAAMQKYLISLNETDLRILMKIHKKNVQFLKSTVYKSII